MQPYIGQISLMAFGFSPRYWAPCDGRLLAISTNQALFSLLGTTYGGDGVRTFGLPDLRGRAAMHFGQNPQGAQGGVEAVALTQAQIPAHTHVVNASGTTGASAPATGNLWAVSAGGDLQYSSKSDTAVLDPRCLGGGGLGQAHSNMHPSTVLNFVIALSGIFPSRP